MQTNEHPFSAEAALIHHFAAAVSAMQPKPRPGCRNSRYRHPWPKVTSKTIILYLIAELEMTTDIVKLDVLRNVLEIVVGRTPDDEGF